MPLRLGPLTLVASPISSVSLLDSNRLSQCEVKPSRSRERPAVSAKASGEGPVEGRLVIWERDEAGARLGQSCTVRYNPQSGSLRTGHAANRSEGFLAAGSIPIKEGLNMTKSDWHGPAFPTEVKSGKGMTLKDYVAIHAL